MDTSQLLALHSQGLSNRAIAVELKVAKVTVDRKLFKLDLKPNNLPNHKPVPLAARFWAKVRKTDTCWLWEGSCNAKGYGTLTVDYYSTLAHRVSLKLAGVELPKGKQVLHSCDNPPCVNPAHLSVGTQQDNTADMVAKGRQKGAVGTNNANAKLSEDDILEIREKWLDGATQTALAEEYGVSQPMIGYIVRKERWTHI